MLLLIGKGTTCLVVRKINSPSILPSCILHAGILIKKKILLQLFAYSGSVCGLVFTDLRLWREVSRATEVAACQSGFILKMKA